MKTSAIPVDEDERIAAMYPMNVIESEAEEEFDDLAELASQICKTPYATITLISKKRIFLKAKRGITFSQFLQDNSFCTNPMGNELVVVENTLEDDRFCNNPLVLEEPHIRFYASVPFTAENGFVTGQLSVYDSKERTLSHHQISGLQKLAKQVSALLTLQSQVEKYTTKGQEYSNSIEQKSTLFQNAVHAIVVLNNEGTILQWNQKAETIFGWNKKEVIGKSFNETIIAEDFRNAYTARIKDYEKTGEENVLNKTIEISALRNDKSKLDIELGISPTLIKDQLFYICYVSDNTDRKLVTSRLDKQKEFYESILNKIPTDITVFDPEHKYLFVNPVAIKDTELRRYIIGKDDFEYAEYRNRDKSIAEKRREKFLEVKHSNKEIRWEDTVKDPAGNNITNLRRLFPVYSEDGELMMVIGFGIDITERKIMEEKQSALVKQLSAQNNQLVDFCNIVSHNLRAPLVNMAMLAKFIEESADKEEQKVYISMLNPVIENLHTTFNELIESIQIQQDIEIESENIILDDCLKRTLSGLELKIKECGAVIDTDFEAARVVYYPSKYMHSIFHNLLTNALKYHDPQRKPVIQLKTQRTDDTVLFSVTDNGLGIDVVKHKDNIFKIGKVFHRHPNAKGFGLFMTKIQVEAMGGRIWVESTPGKGSTFFIEFINQGK